MTTTLHTPPIADQHRAAPAPNRRRRRADQAALAGLLTATAVLYLWGLSASGWANAFYSAAAQAGSESWTAWFFGSSDAANAITVDKPPAALWITGLSVRIFGLSSWSILVPQALMGVATVGLLYAAVRRTAGPAAGLLAGATLALTPVAVLMFRFNNPDALLTLLLVAASYATLRAVEAGRARWLVLAAALVGLGFLTKMLQAYLVLPALTAVWLLAAPVGLGRRLRGLALAAVALVASSAWWVLVVQLWPTDLRPYIGGSQTNSVWELVFGYNGLGRLTGDEVGSVGGGAGAGGGWGQTGLTRLFDAEFGGAVAWLLPAALVLLAALLWRTRRASRTDPLRAAAVLWGGWLLVTAAVFSLMAGIFHGYYLVALAPAIAALVGIGAVVLWRDRATSGPRRTLAAVAAVTAAWAFVLLRRTSDWQPWLAWAVLGLGAVAALGLLVVSRTQTPTRGDADPDSRVLTPRLAGGPASRGLGVPESRARRLIEIGVVTAAVLAGLAGPAAYSIATAATPHTGAIPNAGPAGAGMGGPGGRFGPGMRGGAAGGNGGGPAAAGQPGSTGRDGSTDTGRAGLGSGRAGAGTNGPAGGGTGTFPGGPGRGTGGGPGGLLGSPTPGPDVVTALKRDAGNYTWAAAAVGSNTAAGYQLASQLPVMAVGGFNGTDPSPTLAQFQDLVAQGRVHWFVGSGTGAGPAGPGSSQAGGPSTSGPATGQAGASATGQTAGRGGALLGDTSSGGSDEARRIAEWVAATFTPVTVDGTTLYDLTPAA